MTNFTFRSNRIKVMTSSMRIMITMCFIKYTNFDLSRNRHARRHGKFMKQVLRCSIVQDLSSRLQAFDMRSNARLTKPASMSICIYI